LSLSLKEIPNCRGERESSMSRSVTRRCVPIFANGIFLCSNRRTRVTRETPRRPAASWVFGVWCWDVIVTAWPCCNASTTKRKALYTSSGSSAFLPAAPTRTRCGPCGVRCWSNAGNVSTNCANALFVTSSGRIVGFLSPSH